MPLAFTNNYCKRIWTAEGKVKICFLYQLWTSLPINSQHNQRLLFCDHVKSRNGRNYVHAIQDCNHYFGSPLLHHHCKSIAFFFYECIALPPELPLSTKSKHPLLSNIQNETFLYGQSKICQSWSSHYCLFYYCSDD